jgi:hypothetical protein
VRKHFPDAGIGKKIIIDNLRTFGDVFFDFVLDSLHRHAVNDRHTEFCLGALTDFSGLESNLFLPVISPAKIFFQPDVEADEKITAAHLAHHQLRLADTTVTPGDGNDGP